MNLLLVTFIFASYGVVKSYLPVFTIPGFGDPPTYMENICKEIARLHPGTFCKVIQPLGPEGTLLPMWKQVELYRHALQPYFNQYQDGVHVIAASLGAVTVRGVIETTNHTVKNYISLVGPHAGIFGLPFTNTSVFGYANVQNLSAPALSDVFYTAAGQQLSPAAGLWNDPNRQQDYLSSNIFLPVLNNLVDHPDNNTFKANYLHPNKAIYFGGDKDTTVIPWISTIWQYIDKDGNIIPMTDQDFYKYDTFGLRTQDEQGNLITHVVAGAVHSDFQLNISFVEKYYIQYLY